MEILTPFQQEVLRAIGQTTLARKFYLTGGTALSAFYLHHRYSVDLDFFTADPTAIAQVATEMTAAGQQVGAEVTFTRTLNSFLECFLHRREGEHVEMDFAQDTPYRLAPVEENTEYHIQIDNLTDIAANKLSALFDRAEPKDFVDVYFLCQEVMPFAELVEQARNKHVGIDDYWLAVALQRVTQVEFLPRLIKPVTIEQLQTFFLEQAKQLMRRLSPDG